MQSAISARKDAVLPLFGPFYDDSDYDDYRNCDRRNPLDELREPSSSFFGWKFRSNGGNPSLSFRSHSQKGREAGDWAKLIREDLKAKNQSTANKPGDLKYRQTPKSKQSDDRRGTRRYDHEEDEDDLQDSSWDVKNQRNRVSYDSSERVYNHNHDDDADDDADVNDYESQDEDEDQDESRDERKDSPRRGQGREKARASMRSRLDRARRERWDGDHDFTRYPDDEDPRDLDDLYGRGRFNFQRRRSYLQRFRGRRRRFRDQDKILDYWDQTRRPMPCLIFLLPFLALYELGVVWLGGPTAEPLRTGADAWLRGGLLYLGLSATWLLPFLLTASLLVWHLYDRRRWRWKPRASTFLGMTLESLIWAVGLIGLSRCLDIVFSAIHGGQWVLAVDSAQPYPEFALALGFIGAGIYEESLFRLALIPFLTSTFRVLMAPKFRAILLAILVSAVIFSLAHHAGAHGEPFAWFPFIFRFAAGVAFATLFVLRGFGIAVGAHIAYDMMVGWLGWHF